MRRRTAGLFWESLTQLETYTVVKLIPAAAGTFGYLDEACNGRRIKAAFNPW